MLQKSVCFTLFHSFYCDCTITTLEAWLLFSVLIFKGAILCCPAFTLISPANIHPGSLMEVSSNIIIVAVSLLVFGPKPSVSSAAEWMTCGVTLLCLYWDPFRTFCCINRAKKLQYKIKRQLTNIIYILLSCYLLSTFNIFIICWLCSNVCLC